MIAAAALHPEVLLSLADEIRQTISWLGQQEDPSVEQLAYRIRTLREAASVAGLESVGSVLTGLEEQLAGMEGDSERTGLALETLSSAVLSMANSLQDRQMEWVSRFVAVERTLQEVIGELGSSLDLLWESRSILQAGVPAPTEEERLNLLLKVSDNLHLEHARQRRLRDQLRDGAAALRSGTRQLSSELAKLVSVPLLPVLIKTREQARVLGRDLGKPVSLHPRCTGVEVSTHQFEPLARVLEHLVREAVQEGIESPSQRRTAGKPTVGVLKVTATSGSGMLQITLRDDGRQDRREVSLPRETQSDLSILRARLLRDPPGKDGQLLRLQLPAWQSAPEVILVNTPAGEMLVPLSVIGEVFAGSGQPAEPLPVVSLGRRTGDSECNIPESGVIFEIGGWRGVMYAELLNTHFRVLPSPPQAGDPPWVTGWVRTGTNDPDATGGRPLVHPLVFMEPAADQTCLFPSVLR